ncbi:MAG: T9SS type A sorting domain-containing protein [Candidatus Marinimicrobia bacterium]|nr:T9SS type A sorting domain-containing protein [Candidatus Neomarinimicrobiota bacterium]
MNFGEGRTFRVLPSKAYHEFSPPYRLVSLNQFNPTNNAMDFQVINMISISGYAKYDTSGTSGALCGENNVQIWIDGEYRGTRTNQDGYYLLEVEPGRTVTIQPHKPGREVYDFMPQTKTFFNVISPQSQTFVDGKKRTIMVSVTGGACEFPLGPDEVARASLSAINGCFETEAYVNAGGLYRFPDLAPMAYNLSVTMNMDIAGVDELLEMDTYFRNNGKSINIEASYNLLDSVWTTAEDTVKFNYHTALDFTVEGLERNELNNYGLEQNRTDTLDIKVFERYYGGNICMLDTGSVHIKDWISDRYIDGVEDSDTLHYTFSADPTDIETSTLRYGLMPGLPNLTLPYTKNIEIQVADQSGYRTRVKSISAVVLGHFPRNIDFATTAPEMPLVILRRPPGDGSTASFTETSSSSTNFSLSFAGAASHEYSLKAKLGVESTIMTAPMGVGTAFNTKAQYSMEAGYKATFSLKTDNTLQITTTTSTEYTTATAVGLMGHRGTVFIGGAVNLLYGTTDVLSIVGEGATAHYAVNSEALFVPNGFATTYIYSRGYIEDLLIPELMSLVETDPDLARDIDIWEHLLAYEDSLRWATSMEDNYSLSGGGQSMTISTETTNSESITLETEIELVASVASSNGYEVAGFGISGNAKTSVALTFGSSVGAAWTNSTATSFTLMDDDFGDDFSVDVGTDDVYGTPVFNVVAGNSSCPYEEWRNEAGDIVTTPLDEPGQSWITASTMENIHPQGSAEYWIRLSNLADFPEPRTYYLSYVSASNYNGAIIRINGEDADESAPIPIELEYLGSDSAYITVTRPEGSDIYEFDDLVLKFAPECETNYAGVTEGYRVSFDAHFARPCTEAEIYQPGENWIINTVTGDSLTIIADEYDLGQSYFDNLIVQYSAMDEDSWFAVDTLDADTLRAYGSSYSQLFWDVGSLPDGVYDVRLQSVCLDGLLNNNMAGVRGVIDRQNPEVLGAPEPIDGVLNFNDEIALNFTEPINPETVHDVNISLFDESTETEITDFQISVSEERVVLIPGLLNRYIENHTLVARVTGHQDLHGNPGEPVEWEFVVDRNPVAWSTSELSHIAFQGQEQPLFIQLNNTGSSPESFQFSSSPSQTIAALPEWLTIFPLQGSLNPGGSFEIRLEVDQDLNNGEYDITVYAVTSEGYEPLRLDIVSMCPYPDWSFDFTEYEYSMNVTASLYSMSTASEDIYDRVAAFVNGECRGWAQLEYVPAFGNYQAFVTIFSNQFSGEAVEFHLWDRTACSEYWQVDTSLVFVDGAFHGSPIEPMILNASGVLGQTLSLNTGFTWISLNLEASDMSVSNILKDVQASDGDRVIGHTAFAMYSDTSGWVGPLSSLDHYSMIQLDLAAGGELVHVGYPIQADTVHMEISSGWNWISYLPEENMNVNHALASLTLSSNDLIKNQTQYAQYVQGIGWLGSLNRMFPGMGYKLESLEAGVLTYPTSESISLARRAVDEVLPDAPWVLEDEYQFQNSMSITALLESDTIGVNNPSDAIAAFVGDEVRGLARPIYIPELDAYRVFLLVHGEPGEEINLKIWDADSDIIYGATQSVGFHNDAIHGSPLQPLMLFRAALAIGDKGYIPEVYSLSQNFPNPFNPTTKIGFGLPEDAEVSIQIYNLRGQRVVSLMEGPLTAGYRFIKWSGLDERQHQVPSGVYIVVMNTDSFRAVKKMVMLK